MNIFSYNSMASRRIIAGIMLLGLAVLTSACTTQTKRLDSGATGITGRPVAVLSNPAKPMHIGMAYDSTLAAGLVVSLVDSSLKAARGTYEKSSQLVPPSVNPTRLVEGELLSTLAAKYRLAPQAPLSLDIKPVKNSSGWPNKERIAAIVAGAQRQNFDGIVLDIVTDRYEALTHGGGITIGGAKVIFSYHTRVAVIDTANGKVLASGFCVSNERLNMHKLKTVLAGGQGFVDDQIRKIADNCARDMKKKLSL